jgi:hypothetical protein
VPDERIAFDLLNAYRTLKRLRREAVRLQAIDTALGGGDQTTARRTLLEEESIELEEYLRASGWDLDSE